MDIQCRLLRPTEIAGLTMTTLSMIDCTVRRRDPGFPEDWRDSPPQKMGDAAMMSVGKIDSPGKESLFFLENQRGYSPVVQGDDRNDRQDSDHTGYKTLYM